MRRSLTIAVVCLATAFIGPLSAQNATKKSSHTTRSRAIAGLSPTPSETSSSGQYGSGDLEDLRGRLLDLHETLTKFAAIAPRDSVDLDGLAQVKTGIQQMPYQHLNTLRQSISPSKLTSRISHAKEAVRNYSDFVAQRKLAHAHNTPAMTITDPTPFPAVSAFCSSQGSAVGAGQPGGNSVGASGGTVPMGDGTSTQTGNPVPGSDMSIGGTTYDPASLRISTDIILAADVIRFVADTVQDLSQDACKETILGENGSLACIIVDALALIADAVDEGIHFCDDDVTSNVGDTSYLGLKDVHDDLFTVGNALSGQVTNVNTDIDTNLTNDFNSLTTTVNGDATVTDTLITNDFNALTTQISQGTALLQAYLKQIMKLELTPDGQKVIVPAILTCTGTNCPNVLAKCPKAGCSWNNVGPLP